MPTKYLVFAAKCKINIGLACTCIYSLQCTSFIVFLVLYTLKIVYRVLNINLMGCVVEFAVSIIKVYSVHFKVCTICNEICISFTEWSANFK